MSNNIELQYDKINMNVATLKKKKNKNNQSD